MAGKYDMSILKKSFLRLICASVLMSALLSCAPKHYDQTNIDRLYDREKIIGYTESEIVARYGSFQREAVDENGRKTARYYVNYENHGLDPSYIHDTYFIEFDETGIAVDAYFRETSKGG